MLPPFGCVRVVPFENCHEEHGTVRVPLAELSSKQLHIRHQGQDIPAGQVLVQAGIRLRPDHLLLLAANGSQEISVHRQPRVAVICTGSELVQAGAALRLGQKFSGNSVLLAALLHEQGGCCVCAATAEDKAEAIVALIRTILERDQPDALITTGGMGPGKFDVLEQVFSLLGGELFCNRLTLRPGRATLAGMLGSLPFIALPGPPPAARLLFHELAAPVLRKLHGEARANGLVEALLACPLRVRQAEADELIVQGGKAWLGADGQLRVRPAETLEPVNAVIHLGAGESGRVAVRLVGPLRLFDEAG
jgi:molybdopterin molybdotransferase